MYDPDNRRFQAVDPVKGEIVDPLSLVQYLYVLDNPLNWIDLLGLKVYNLGESVIETMQIDGYSGNYASIRELLSAYGIVFPNRPNSKNVYSVSTGTGLVVKMDMNSKTLSFVNKSIYDTDYNWNYPEIYVRSLENAKKDNKGQSYWLQKKANLLLQNIDGSYYMDINYFQSIMCQMGYDLEMTRAEWLPDRYILNSETSLGRTLIKLGFEQEKIDTIWDSTIMLYKVYGLQLDPRLLLSIIGIEGTKSFNTSPTNLAADGQHGYEADFALDLMRANDLMFGKLLGYIYYADSFEEAVETYSNYPGIGLEGTFAKYANWYTPILSVKNQNIRLGVYAGSGTWNESVTHFYDSMVGEGGMAQYSDYLKNLDAALVLKIYGGELPEYEFVPSQNAQNSKGQSNGEYTIIGNNK